MSYGADAPAYWDPSLAADESSMLEQEQCIITRMIQSGAGT
jgi:hypothetical protein